MCKREFVSRLCEEATIGTWIHTTQAQELLASSRRRPAWTKQASRPAKISAAIDKSVLIVVQAGQEQEDKLVTRLMAEADM